MQKLLHAETGGNGMTLSRLGLFAAIFIYSFVFSLVLIGGGKASPVMALGLIFVPLSLVHSDLFFNFFLVFRPLVDIAAKTSIMGMNPASWVTLAFIVFCLKDFLTGEKSRAFESQPLLRNFNGYFCVLLFLCLPSFIQTGDMRISAIDFIRLLSLGIAVNYVLTGFYRSEKDVERFCDRVVLSAFVPLALGLYQWAFHTGKQIEGYNRVYGPFTHPNVFAEYLLLIFFVCFYRVMNYPMKNFRKSVYFLILFLTVFSLYQTYTRTMWIAFAVCISIYSALQKKPAVKIAFFSVIGCFFVGAFPLIRSRFADILDSSKFGRSSLDWRFDLWTKTIGGIKKHPFFGSGLGMYEYKIGVMAHNDVLRMAFETGLLTTVVYLFGFLLLIAYGFQRMKKMSADSAAHSRVQIGICLIVGFLISSLADNMIRSTVIAFYYLTTAMLFLSEQSRPRRAS